LDGVLREVLQVAPSHVKPLLSRLKIMADLDIAEKRRPQDGRIRVKQGESTIDIRVSTLPTDFGEKMVLRILDKSRIELNLQKLGFEERNLKVFRRTIRLPYGMVLVTGPTGSGKTTTLYAALQEINRPELNITTIEDPIEYNLAGINQTHVRPEIGLTFAAALRSILRQDPNVIMVGEIRDSETAEIAIRAALTGHLVFSTLHTNDAPSAITRLVDMGVEPFLVASSVKLILAQRLLRHLCPHCRTPVVASPEQAEELGLRGDGHFFRGKGCQACSQLGYRGRTAAVELLPVGNGLGAMISRGASANDLRSQAQAEGMVPLREAALSKAARGETSLDEVIRETAV
jgi:type IV pilus assembly protein PilB